MTNPAIAETLRIRYSRIQISISFARIGRPAFVTGSPRLQRPTANHLSGALPDSKAANRVTVVPVLRMRATVHKMLKAALCLRAMGWNQMILMSQTALLLRLFAPVALMASAAPPETQTLPAGVMNTQHPGDHPLSPKEAV